MIPLKKSIFITGAASGIGRSAALLFAKKGWWVGLFDINEQALVALYKKIGEKNSCFQVMNVADPESVQAAADTFGKHTDGRMDVLLNNAGVLQMGGFEKLNLADHKKIFDINVSGVLNCIHICLNMLKDTPHSHIINMSSSAAIYGTPELSSYSATKCSVRSLTEALNIEFEGYGIMVCDVMPAFVQTPMIENQTYRPSSIEKIGVKLTPEDVAEIIWKAAHGNKVHWYLGHMVKTLWFLAPFTFLMKKMTKMMT